MRLPSTIQTIVNEFCVQTGQGDVSLQTIFDLLVDVDPVLANEFLSRPGISMMSILRPGPVICRRGT